MDAGEERMDVPAKAQPIEISVAAENTEVLMPENLSHAEVLLLHHQLKIR